MDADNTDCLVAYTYPIYSYTDSIVVEALILNFVIFCAMAILTSFSGQKSPHRRQNPWNCKEI